ncbi:FAD-dependent monooxygenase [Amycolatopsis sp. cmx-4-61]|uniref:FAD-dependent monooxygenase n=1 Tax=Amycolatopsis sp. cmx-4-61 TaxID=2790937 RepID=UPI00397E4B53
MEPLSVVERTEVVIVGAGPTGLTAAVRLAALGVPHVVLDSALEPTRTSNAALVHAATIELLAALGLGEELVRAGRRVHRIGMVDRGRPLVRVGLTGLPSRYPFALGVPQSTTEQLLLHRLAELGGSVRRGHRVTSVRTEGTRHVVAGTVEPDGGAAGFAVSARYVIGADGAHSTIRSATGVGFPGETYPSQFVLADVALSTAAGPDDEATINLSPEGVTVLGRLPGPNHRIIATVGPTATVPEAPDRQFVDALLAQRGIAARSTAEPVWSSRFRVHHRVADRFRVDGVFLAGDAAHVHSPAAGQGMNTGIADAYDVATRLGAVLTGHADEPVLDGYERQRRAAALEVLAFTDRLTKLAMLENPLARLGRRVAAGTVLRFPWPLQRRITMWVSGLGRSPLRQDLPATGEPSLRVGP